MGLATMPEPEKSNSEIYTHLRRSTRGTRVHARFIRVGN